MGKVQDIKGKIVDYQVTDSANNLNIGTEEELGKMTAVIRESETEPNSLYVGDVHIASGYGFDNLETLTAVENLLKNTKLRDILDGNASTDVLPDTTPEVIPINQDNTNVNISGIYLHNDSLAIVNNQFIADTWLTISDIRLTLLENDIKNVQLETSEIYETSMLNDIKIKSMSFKYNITKQSDNGKYDVHYRIELGNDTSLSISNTPTVSLISNGRTSQTETININKQIVQDTSNWNTQTDVTLIIGDGTNTSYIKLCTIIFKYPVFATITTNLNSIGDYEDERVDLYTVGEGAKVAIPSPSSDSYNYIWVPTIMVNQRLQFIFNESNIGCYFNPANGISGMNIKDEFILTKTTLPILYNMYRSPKQYKAGKTMIWVVK